MIKMAPIFPVTGVVSDIHKTFVGKMVETLKPSKMTLNHMMAGHSLTASINIWAADVNKRLTNIILAGDNHMELKMPATLPAKCAPKYTDSNKLDNATDHPRCFRANDTRNKMGRNSEQRLSIVKTKMKMTWTTANPRLLSFIWPIGSTTRISTSVSADSAMSVWVVFVSLSGGAAPRSVLTLCLQAKPFTHNIENGTLAIMVITPRAMKVYLVVSIFPSTQSAFWPLSIPRTDVKFSILGLWVVWFCRSLVSSSQRKSFTTSGPKIPPRDQIACIPWRNGFCNLWPSHKFTQ